MKKILIVGMALNVGGAEKSLVNLLNLIDYTEYRVDLLLFQKRGSFLKQVPEQVNFIEQREVTILYQSWKDTLKMPNKKLSDLYLTCIRYIGTLIEKSRWSQFDQIRIHRWHDFYNNLIPQNEEKYDVAVAYYGGETAYYTVDKVKADRKVYFFHSDYSNIDIDVDLEREYVDKVDVVFTISDVCKQSLDKLFPEKKEDIYVLNNLSSPKLIQKLSEEYIPVEFDMNSSSFKIVSIGRLHEIKGYDMAIDAAKILKDKGIDFRWVVVGDGDERKNLESQIKKNGLEKEFILAGLKENPYPYIGTADVLIQTSRFEGKSVVLDEAKILRKPMIVTNYPSAHDQIRDGVDGMIVDMNAIGIAKGIEEVYVDKSLLARMAETVCPDEAIDSISDYMNVLVGK